MSILAETIPRQGSNATASYDFRDLVSGLGYDTFYAVASDEEALGTISYYLSPTADIYTDTTSTTQSSQGTKTLNFDSSAFNLPRTVRGTAIINFSGKNNDADVTNVTFSAQLLKVLADGTTTQALSSAKVVDYDGNTPPGSALGASVKFNALLFLSLTQTLIKKGEKLRLQIIIDMKDTADSVTIYHDPLGRNIIGDTNFSSIMKAIVPFRIDQ